MSVCLVQARDLSEWDDEPSRFHAQADLGSWQEHPRAVAESFFRILLQVHLIQLCNLVMHGPQPGNGCSLLTHGHQVRALGKL